MNKIIIWILCAFFPFACSAQKYQLSILAIFQDEAPYLKEWIDYHLDKGVEHFWLYNNNSKDNYSDILKPYIKRKVVTLIDWPSEENGGHHFFFEVQSPAYNGIKLAKHKTKWLAIIDTDEFIVPIKCKKISEILQKDYSQYAGLCVNWQCYGTSGIKEVPLGKITQYLTMKMKWDAPLNKQSKSIVQPIYVSNCPNPHCCEYIKGHFAVDANHNECKMCPNEVNIDKIRINHYWTRDENYLYNKKIPRYMKWNGCMENVIEIANMMNAEYDPILVN